ncbi:MAG TPA: hypothetical protein DEP84_07305, partial [Chloroflexi bacterium]|nr:hypothetical protein [Chloroflexota bacterium]
TTPGTALEIPVLWQSLRPAGQDLTVFVHLVGTDGTPLVQADRQPTGGFFPTGRWRPGDRVPDTITLTLPSGLPAGEYRLLVGLYDVSTGARLSLPDGTDAFVLATLRVEAAS